MRRVRIAGAAAGVVAGSVLVAGCGAGRRRGGRGAVAIIANNFASAAREITVTIQPTGGLFKAEGCGTWKPVG